MNSAYASRDAAAAATALLRRFPTATAVAVADPQHPGAPLAAGDLVLGVGIGQPVAAELLASARAGGAAAVLLRRPAAASEQAELERLAAAEQVPLHWLEPEHSWNELHRQLVNRLTPAAIRADDELADLAQTIATLTGGLVTIEDTSARVLAYSRSSDEVDELRRLSILGRSGPAQYLALLREWGVYDRLASSEEVVEIAEHPESGVRRRLAVGVFAGDRQLATIWLQQGSGDFEPHAEQALLGAARITAAQLVSRGKQPPGAGAELAGLLGLGPGGSGLGPAGSGLGPGGSGLGPGGSAEPAGAASLPARLGRAARQPCAVAVVELGPGTRDAATAGSQLDELAAILTVHAAAYRRAALVEQLQGRVYLLLPALDSVTAATAMLRRAMAAVRRHLDPAARAALGPIVDSAPVAAQSRQGAELALGVAGTDPVTDFDTARPRLLIAAIENCLTEHGNLVDPRVSDLIRTDPDGAWTLLNYLEAGSDVGRVAAWMHLHPTTVRYRLRRAIQATGIDLSGGADRFALHVQLRCGLRPELSEG